MNMQTLDFISKSYTVYTVHIYILHKHFKKMILGRWQKANGGLKEPSPFEPKLKQEYENKHFNCVINLA